MNKKINSEAIGNELRGASAFFAQAAEETPASEAASTTASRLAFSPDPLIERIRKTVKPIGREVSFIRLTPDEKRRLEAVVYDFKRGGMKTTENEINRIAVNMMLEDFQARGKESVLAQVLDALLA